jgi:epimerase transport system membrane fusion protein
MSLWPASRADLDFASADLYANPVAPARAGFAVIAAFVMFLAAWGALAPISGAAIAEGNLQVEAQRQSVQHPYGGVVARLMVREGQRVDKGATLLMLADAEPRARLDVLLADRTSQLAQEGRLIAERDGAAEPAFAAELLARKHEALAAQAMANEQAVMTARLRQFEAGSGMLRQKIGQLNERIGGLRAQIEGLRRQAALLEEEAQGARELLKSGYTPKTRVLALERNAAQLEADRGARVGDVAAAEQEIGEAELAIARLQRERVTDITDQLRATQSKLADLAPRIEAARDVLDRTRVTAPVSGDVVGLTVFTEGGVIQQGARVLDIVPLSNPLIIEGRLQLTDVNEVKPGTAADVRLTSVPRSERPTLRGEVITVSADKLTDQQSGRGYYLVRVRPHPDDLRNVKLDLQPGMPAEVVVTTRPRTFVGYLTSPLFDEISRAFREK